MYRKYIRDAVSNPLDCAGEGSRNESARETRIQYIPHIVCDFTKEVPHTIGGIHYTYALGIITEQSNITKHYYTLISSHCNVAVMAGSTCVGVSRTWIFYTDPSMRSTYESHPIPITRILSAKQNSQNNNLNRIYSDGGTEKIQEVPHMFNPPLHNTHITDGMTGDPNTGTAGRGVEGVAARNFPAAALCVDGGPGFGMSFLASSA